MFLKKKLRREGGGRVYKQKFRNFRKSNFCKIHMYKIVLNRARLDTIFFRYYRKNIDRENLDFFDIYRKNIDRPLCPGSSFKYQSA